MTTSYTLTGNLGSVLGGSERLPRIIRATIGTNLGDVALVDFDNNEVRMSRPVKLALNDDLSFSVSLLATNSTGTNIPDGSLRYVVNVQYVDSGQTTVHSWSSGYFELTTNRDLSDVAGSDVAMAVTPLPAPSLIDAATASNIDDPASETAVALSAKYVETSKQALNILDYGVVRGTAATQTAAIKAALDANPGKTFIFPAGDYRLDTTLAITANNSIVLDGGARLYAGAAMTTLIDYDNGLTVTNYAQDACLIGNGLIDAALLASKALAIGSVIRFSLGGGLTIKDPVNRGIYLKAAGAEVIGNDIRLYNSGTTNVADNCAIENDMGDCQFSHIITRDFTVGAIDNGSATWDDFHPWIGTTAQLTARYENSVGFVNKKRSRLKNYYADTYRYDYRSAATSGYAAGFLTAFKSFTNTGNLTDSLAAAYPGAVFDMVDGGFLYASKGEFSGHGTTPRAFVQGTTTRLNISDSVTLVGGVTGIADYRRGVRITNATPNVTPFTRGNATPFSPTLYGSSVAGTTTYTTQSGTMEVRDGIVYYRFRVAGTLGATSAGNLRIGGLPFPPGAVSVSTGHGPLSRSVGFASATHVFGANGTSGTLVAIPFTAAAAEIAATPSTVFEIFGEVTCPFTYPS